MADKKEKERPSFKKLKEWADHYGRADVPDDRGVLDFMECEPRESISSLRAELIAIVDGNFEERILDTILTKRRKAKYGSYTDWARLMLLWISGFKG